MMFFGNVLVQLRIAFNADYITEDDDYEDDYEDDSNDDFKTSPLEPEAEDEQTDRDSPLNGNDAIRRQPH
jgi:hypothetical protein